MDVRGLIDDPERIALVAQPIVDLKRGVVVGYEVLSRFSIEPYATPDKVFAEAAKQGLGVELDATVIARGLALARRRPADCFLALNVDPNHLLEPAVQAALSEPKTLAGIVLELTEHRPVDDMKAVTQVLDQLRRRGALIAVDDAGSGYSGLRQLLELRPQILKIDRELVTNVHEDGAKHAMIQMLGELAGRLDAWLLAEGVESENELAVLRQLGVPLAQGYFLAKPAPPWSEVLPRAQDALAPRSLGHERVNAVRRLLEPCAICAEDEPWPTDALVVRLSDEGRPVGMRIDQGDRVVLRAELELLRVKSMSTLASVARRAATRPDPVRWDPVVCIDDRGHFRGIVRMHRLVGELAEMSGSSAAEATLH